MFPLGDVEKAGKFPFITLGIIALNLFTFYQILVSPDPEQFVRNFALVPATISLFNFETLVPFITSMFLHGGFLHIISNMWFLWIFGDNVEERLGFLGYPLLYFLSGLVGSIAQYLLNPESSIPMLGASGAISGVLGAYFVLFPHHRIRSAVLLFFVITVVNIPAGIYLFYWFFLQFISGVASIPSLSTHMGGVAFFAHIGGFMTGVLLANFFKRSAKGYIEGEIVN